MLHDRCVLPRAAHRQREGISAPVLSRRLADLVEAGFLTKNEVARGKQGRYSLTEQGLATVPLLIELGRLGAHIDPSTAHNAPNSARIPTTSPGASPPSARLISLINTHPTTTAEDAGPHGPSSQR